jgi:hypothetical protein
LPIGLDLGKIAAASTSSIIPLTAVIAP